MSDARVNSRMYIVTLGFAVSVGMWLTGYVCHLPSVAVPRPLTLALMLAWLVAGGAAARRGAAASVGGAAAVGLVSALVNLLILGSLISSGDATNAVVPSAIIWIPGSFALSALLAGAAAAVTPRREHPLDASAWRCGFGLVAATSTLLVVIAGGLVTSLEAGLAVPDWPNSYGWNMFLYPLAQMTADAGIYYEHAHRLYGSLVGLTIIVLALVMWRGLAGRWRWFGVALVVMVVAQGVLGGTRVTATNTPLAILHGVFGQVVFVCVTLAWAVMTRAWREARPQPHEAAGTERTLGGVFLALLVAQLASGALYRHLYTEETPMPWPAHLHLTLAAVVACLGIVVGLRAWARYPQLPMLRRLGAATMVLIGVQLLLGIAALIAVLARRDGPQPFEVIITTAHQANGALVFAAGAQIAAWTRRLLTVEITGKGAVSAQAV